MRIYDIFLGRIFSIDMDALFLMVKSMKFVLFSCYGYQEDAGEILRHDEDIVPCKRGCTKTGGRKPSCR